MPAADGAAFLLYVKEKEEDELLYQRWIVQSQFVMGFDEFKHYLKPRKAKSDEEILRDVEGILKSMEVGEIGTV